MTDDIRCSFCEVSRREILACGAHKTTLIAGPRDIFICADCVQLCVDILIEKRATGVDGATTVIGDNIDLVGQLTRERDAAAKRARQLEFEMSMIAKSVARVMPASHAVRCSWCEVALDGEAAAREHVATCDKHPAVIKLHRQQASKPRRLGARRTT